MGTKFPSRVMECSRIRECWSHNTGNGLNATELFTLKWLK